MRVAAIDCGSNSFHLLIADARGHDQLDVIEDEKTLLYLGAEVASTGIISPTSLTRARRVMRHYKNLIARHDVEVVTCVATSAIRTASNGGDIITALSKTLGHPVHVISGNEEATLIFRAISAVSSLPESRILACDMGGGSLELMAGQRHGLEYCTSVPLGASRIAAQYKVSDPLSASDFSTISHVCHDHFSDFSHSYPRDHFRNVVVSSGTLSCIVVMARAHADGYPPSHPAPTATAQEIEKICSLILESTADERKKFIGYERARHVFLPTAAVIAREIQTIVSPDASWTVSPYALREGIALAAGDEQSPPEHNPREIADKTVADLENRMGAFTPFHKPFHDHSESVLVRHGRSTEQLALNLFDELREIHNLPPSDRFIIGYAARLHDIGETISHSKHDVHGTYILSSIPLVGFSPEDALLLRGVIRWHRTRDPKKKDRYVGQLSDSLFERARWLTALLRIADGADAGKKGIVTSLTAAITPDMIFIRGESDHDCELEMYSARRKRNLLETVSGRDVVIETATHQKEQD